MRRSAIPLFIISVLVLFPAFLIRLHPITSESFVYDVIVSQMAASKGIIANALDQSNVFWERRGHPPLLSYIILVNNSIFGSDEFGARIFSIIAGSLCCLVVSLSVMKIMEGFRWRLPGAIFGGWMICLLPVHLYVSRTSNWDAVYSLFATCSLLFLSLYIAGHSTKNIIAAGIFACLAFLTCEIALLLVPAFIYVFFKDLRRVPVSSALKIWSRLVLLLILLCIVLWPAAILKQNLFRTIIFRIRDSAFREKNLPWFMFYIELFRQGPAFAVLSILGFITFSMNPLIKRYIDYKKIVNVLNVNEMLVPFWLYIATVLVVSVKQSLVYVHHIADMFPPLAILFSCLIIVAFSVMKRTGKAVLIAGCIVVLLFSIQAAMNPDSDVVGPQEHPGYLGIRDFIQNYPEARSYYYYASIMSYYLPQSNFEGGPPRRWTREKIDFVKREMYEFVVTDWTMFNDDYPDIESLSNALNPEYQLAHTILHRRTNQPVAWIFTH
jgi:hypothetical protein